MDYYIFELKKKHCLLNGIGKDKIMKKTKKNVGIYVGISIMAIFYLFLFSWATSPIYYYQVGDSAIFRMLGFLSAKGMVPYTDFLTIRDHFWFWWNIWVRLSV